MGYPFSLVLHTHLPMVVNHGRWPHGSDWLNEAAFECYLPLLETAHRLVADGISPKWTLNISPILTEQLASSEFQKELSFYYENVRRACDESREHFMRAGQKEIVGLTNFWEDFYQRMWELHRRIGGDIPGTFADLQRGGHIELITCGATHGYMPLLSRDESIHLQLRAAVETHRRHFGRAPRGIWLPECAYRPRYEWTPPTGRDRGRRMRPGVEELLAVHGLEYFVADAHLVSAGEPLFLYKDYLPLKGTLAGEAAPAAPPVGKARSPYAPYWVASRGGSGRAAAFFRDPRTTLQVWSREHGYPGDFAYLEFHKKHFPGGLRFWRITDTSNDLGSKQIYDPQVAAHRAGQHARHFAELVRDTLEHTAGRGPALVCSPYDSELFGHWWFEGPLWLEHVARELTRQGVQPMTLGEAMDAVPPRTTLSLPEGSWGEGGDHRVWLNPDTEWTWDRVYSAEAEWVGLLERARGNQASPEQRRALNQATRELMLLQASDWQFLITTGTARDYAERRVAEHYAEFKRLSEMVQSLAQGQPLGVEEENTLQRLEREDFCFPDLDPTWGEAPSRTV
jgi:1,4-alpha-glucan branching enzyme